MKNKIDKNFNFFACSSLTVKRYDALMLQSGRAETADTSPRSVGGSVCHCRLLVLLLLLAGLVLSFPSSGMDMKPLFSFAKDDEEGVVQWSGLGPFFEGGGDEQHEEIACFTAIPRPFYSHYRMEGKKKGGRDIFWPFGFNRYSPRGSYTFLFPFFHTVKQDEGEPSAVKRWWLLPVLFAGQDQDAEWDFALFPAGGSIKRVAGYDRINFILFPLYINLQKKGIDSTFILFPVFHKAEGENLYKWHVFPLIGEKEQDGLRRIFFLWPFFNLVSSMGDKDRGNGFFVFPLFGFYQRELEESSSSMWTFLWPLFSFRRSPAGKKLNCPWPLIQIERKRIKGGESRKLYLWPLWGERVSPNRSYRFWLWPLFQQREYRYRDEQVSRKVIFNFFYGRRRSSAEGRDDTQENDGQDLETDASWQHLWPFYRIEKQGDEERLWALALWPEAEEGAVVRNYAPFWRLFTSVSTGSRTAMQFGWGFWQWEKREKDNFLSTSLFPVFDYEKDDSGWSISLLKGLLKKGVDEKGDLTGRLLWIFSW